MPYKDSLFRSIFPQTVSDTFLLTRFFTPRPRKPRRQLNNMLPAGLSRLASLKSSQSSDIRYHLLITIYLCCVRRGKSYSGSMGVI